MCLATPQPETAVTTLDQFFARGAASPFRGSAALGSLRLTPEGWSGMEEEQITERNLHRL